MKSMSSPHFSVYEYGRAEEQDPERWSIYNTHDPFIFVDDGLYYSVSTDTKVDEEGRMQGGCQLRSSIDLIHWTWEGWLLDGVPDEAYEWTGAKGLWAPEVHKVGNRYYLYYCASRFGKNRSFIGLATSSSLKGEWTDEGEVFKTSYESANNAIDPHIALSKESIPYLVYGSFFGGIYMSEIDQKSGKLKSYGSGKCIARREFESKEGAVEGAFILFNREQDMYYLFVSYDSLFSTYNIRVGRSNSIEGPYVDYHGRDLADTAYQPAGAVGLKLLGGYQFSNGTGWLAPGHNSIFEEKGVFFLVHHARMLKKPDTFCMHIRRLIWTSDGWPLVSIERYAGEGPRLLDVDELVGTWEMFCFEPLRDEVEQPLVMEIGVKVAVIGDANYLIEENNGEFCFVKDSHCMKMQALCAWDWESNKQTAVLMGLDNEGVVFSAKRLF